MLKAHKLPPWIDGELLETLDEEKWNEWLDSNVGTCKRLKDEYFKSMFQSNDEKMAWQGLYELSKDHEIYNKVLNGENFQKIPTSYTRHARHVHRSCVKVDEIETNEEEVKKAIDSLNLVGLVGLSYVKKLKSELITFLVIAINKIFKIGVYPSGFNAHEDVHVFPITEIFKNIFDKILYSRLMAFLSLNDEINDNEIALHIDYLYRKLNYRQKVITIFIDLRATLNSTDNKTLLGILYENEISGKTHRLIESYLKDGRDNGSIIESFLLSLIMKEFRKVTITWRMMTFGNFVMLSNLFERNDDVTDSVRKEVKIIKEFFHSKNIELKHLVFMPFHSIPINPSLSPNTPDKFLIDGVTFKKANEIICADLHLDTALTFNEHLKFLKNKLFLIVKNLRKLRSLRKNELIMIYNALILSNISRYVASWGSSNEKIMEDLEENHISALKIVHNLNDEDISAKNIFKQTKCLPIKNLCVSSNNTLYFLLSSKKLSKEIDVDAYNKEYNSYKFSGYNKYEERTLKHFKLRFYLPQQIQN